MKRNQSPEGQYPTLPKLIKKFLDHPRNVNDDLQRDHIRPNQISKLRITIRNEKRGVWVFPEFEYKNEWFRFIDDSKPLMTLCKAFVINSIELGNSCGLRAKRLKREWVAWLKIWMKENRIKVKSMKKKK
jgi:hypothetical protein